MLVGDLGEFGLIRRIKRLIKTDSSVVVGSGDDCAVLRFDKKHYQLFTCDMIVEGEDFTSKDDPYLVGRKAVAISVSDIASCCGLPRHCLISLGIPGSAKVSFTDKLLKGALSVTDKYGINLAGGDISRSGKVIIDVSMLGIVEKKLLALRSGAKAGDIIFVTGSLGGSISGRHLKFTPRLKEARFLAKNFRINSMIDISDGLAQDLGHILEKSKVGAALYEGLIPLNKEARNLDDALYGGEDFELLFTLPHKEAKKLLEKSSEFKPIGEILDKKYGLRLIDKRSREKTIEAKGFRHF